MSAHVVGLLSLVWAVAMGAPGLDRHAEAQALVEGVALGADPLGAAARIRYLGQEALASAAVEFQLQVAGGEPRRRLIQLLADLGVPRSEPFLTALLDDSDPPVRMFAARGLGRLRARRASDRLRARLADPNAGVRLASSRALGLIGEARAGPALLRAAQSEGEPEVRAAMVEAVGATGDRRQTKALITLLDHSSESTRLAAARSLCLLSSPAGLELAQKRLHSEVSLERREGLALLEGVPLRVARPLLRPLLDGSDRPLAAGAARVLHSAGERGMVDWLVKASHTATPDDRRAIETELERLDVTDAQRKAILKEAGWR